MIWEELVTIIILWLSLSIFVSKYIVREFKTHHLFACLILALIFVAVWIIFSMIIGYIAQYWKELGSIGGLISLIVAMWIWFIIARSLIETQEWKIRENVLFASLILTYGIYALLLTIIEILPK